MTGTYRSHVPLPALAKTRGMRTAMPPEGAIAPRVWARLSRRLSESPLRRAAAGGGRLSMGPIRAAAMPRVARTSKPRLPEPPVDGGVPDEEERPPELDLLVPGAGPAAVVALQDGRRPDHGPDLFRVRRLRHQGDDDDADDRQHLGDRPDVEEMKLGQARDRAAEKHRHHDLDDDAAGEAEDAGRVVDA